MSFKDDLQKEYLDHKERQKLAQEENQHKLEKKTFEQFVKFFGIEPDSVNKEYATKDGLTFHWHYGEFKIQWALAGFCPDCGEECLSKHYLSKISLLEEIFNGFKPHYYHKCYNLDEQPQGSTEEKLVELLKNLIYENSYQG